MINIRRLDTDSDSDDDQAGASNGKTRPARKMSRSWTSTKSEMKKLVVKTEEIQILGDNTSHVSHISVDAETSKVRRSSHWSIT